jgi:hypothetical protein
MGEISSFFAGVRKAKTLSFFALICALVPLAQCGGNTNTTPLPTPQTATSTSVIGAPSTVALPATSEVPYGTITFPSAENGATTSLTITVQPAPPLTVPALTTSAIARKTQATSGANITTGIAAIIALSTATVTFPTAPVFTLTVPSTDIVPGATFDLAYYDPVLQTWNLTWAGPATVSGSVLTFASNGAPFTLAANVAAVFYLLSISPNATASPTASPSPSPSPAPLSLSPTSVSLIIGGTPTTQNIVISQANAQPLFTPTLSCTLGANSSAGTVAQIAAVGSATPSTLGGSVTFAVSVAGTSPAAGTCSGSIASSAGGANATFSVTVTQTGIVLQSASRQ